MCVVCLCRSRRGRTTLLLCVRRAHWSARRRTDASVTMMQFPMNVLRVRLYNVGKFSLFLFGDRTGYPPNHPSPRAITLIHVLEFSLMSQAKFSFRHRVHRTGVHTGANSTPLEGGPWTPFTTPYSTRRRAYMYIPRSGEAHVDGDATPSLARLARGPRSPRCRRG